MACKNCGRERAPEELWGSVTFPVEHRTDYCWQVAGECPHPEAPWRDRALAAEAKLASLAESGTGYSQQTMDAFVLERQKLRDELRAAEAKLQAVREWRSPVVCLSHCASKEYGREKFCDCGSVAERDAMDMAQTAIVAAMDKPDD